MQPQPALDRSPLANLIGSTHAMREIHRLATRMGHSNFPVLILGETGTGKELVARAVHNTEARGPFVVIDCCSMVGPLMESEMFGHQKGAFTGASATKVGLLESANGGTAFFDEIGELATDLQVKLLRVLQEKQFRAVGSIGSRTSNFRVIAATNRDLAVEIQAGRFRRDLFYRLNVMRLRLPPLRERKDDIPALTTYFLDRHGNGCHRVADDTIEALMQYDWPGNIRELEHVVQHMLAMNSGPWLTAADLPSSVSNSRSEGDISRQLAGAGSGNSCASATGMGTAGGLAPPILPLSEVEKCAILEAIRVTKGDRTVAAAMLGIGRTTLYRKLKEYGYE
jgi:DNA-binding NtrC family response regulator